MHATLGKRRFNAGQFIKGDGVGHQLLLIPDQPPDEMPGRNFQRLVDVDDGMRHNDTSGTDG